MAAPSKSPVPRPPEVELAKLPMPATQASGFGAIEELDDAITDEEAADPIIDVGQARAILERTSVFGLERSIPPASYVSVPAPERSGFGKGSRTVRQIAGAVAALAAIAALVVYTAREPDGLPEVKLAVPSAAGRRAVEDAQAAPKIAVSQHPKPAAVSVDGHADVSPKQTVVVTQGPLDVQLVMNLLRHGLPMYDEQCWDKLRVPVGKVAKNPSIRVEFSVDRLGNVYDLKSTVPPAGYRGVGRCVIGRMRGWRFPRAEQGSHAVVTVARVQN